MAQVEVVRCWTGPPCARQPLAPSWRRRFLVIVPMCRGCNVADAELRLEVNLAALAEVVGEVGGWRVRDGLSRAGVQVAQHIGHALKVVDVQAEPRV